MSNQEIAEKVMKPFTFHNSSIGVKLATNIKQVLDQKDKEVVELIEEKINTLSSKITITEFNR